MPDVTIQLFSSFLENNALNNLYVFWGPETYFHDLFMNQIEKKVIPDAASKSFNFHLFYANDISFPEVISTCISYPMLSDKKLVIIKQFDKMSMEDKDSFIKYINNPQPSTVLVLSAETWGKTKFHKEIQNLAVSVNCKNLYEKDVYKWVKSKFDDKQINVDEETVSFLVENIGFNLQRLNVEIEKLSTMVTAEKQLTKSVVSEITGFSKEVNIFNLQHQLGQKKLEDALQIGLKLLEQGEALASIFPMMFLFFKRMWIVKEMINSGMGQKQILAELGGNYFYYKDIFNFHKNFSNKQFINIFKNLENSELLLKTSQKPDESILTMIIYNICKI